MSRRRNSTANIKKRANAEAAETLPAYNKGARGVGLFRTEHMFLGDRLPYIQKVLFGNDKAEAKKALDAIYNFSKEDFKHSMSVMDGYGVTIPRRHSPFPATTPTASCRSPFYP